MQAVHPPCAVAVVVTGPLKVALSLTRHVDHAQPVEYQVRVSVQPLVVPVTILLISVVLLDRQYLAAQAQHFVPPYHFARQATAQGLQ